MKRMIVLSILVTPLFIANAVTTNVWTNGSGDFLFSTAGNWSGEAVPSNGAVLSFPSGGNVTNDLSQLEVGGLAVGSSNAFVMNGEPLVIQTSAGLEGSSGDVTFNNAIELPSGEHVFKLEGELSFVGRLNGSGNIEVVCSKGKTLSFVGDKPDYTGNIWATNSVMTTKGGHQYSMTGKGNEVHVYRWKIFNNGNRLSSNLFIYENTGSTSAQGIYDYCGATGLYGNLTLMGGTRFYRNNTADAFFINGKVRLNGFLYPEIPTIGVKFAFNDVVVQSASDQGFYTTGYGVGTYTFNAAGNDFSRFDLHGGGGHVVFTKANAMPQNGYVYFSAPTSGGNAFDASLTVAGDQTCLDIRGENSAEDPNAHYFVRASETSTITMKGNWDRGFYGSLDGPLSLIWSPTADKCYRLGSATAVNTMSGTLGVTAGSMVLTAGQSYPNLSEILVDGTATLTIPAGVSINPTLTKITVGPKAHLVLEEGVSLTPDYFYVGMDKMWKNKTYTGADGVPTAKQIAQITGAGTVTPRKGRSGLALFFR